jgi:hypothetical protein
MGSEEHQRPSGSFRRALGVSHGIWTVAARDSAALVCDLEPVPRHPDDWEERARLVKDAARWRCRRWDCALTVRAAAMSFRSRW